MCGMTDVRRRSDGEYYCTICGRELGKDFDDQVLRWSGASYYQQLRRQCDPDKANKERV